MVLCKQGLKTQLRNMERVCSKRLNRLNFFLYKNFLKLLRLLFSQCVYRAGEKASHPSSLSLSCKLQGVGVAEVLSSL